MYDKREVTTEYILDGLEPAPPSWEKLVSDWITEAGYYPAVGRNSIPKTLWPAFRKWCSHNHPVIAYIDRSKWEFEMNKRFARLSNKNGTFYQIGKKKNIEIPEYLHHPTTR